MKFVYLIESEIAGEFIYKIGITTDLEKRKKQLSTGNTDINIINYFQSKWASKLESSLHNYYKYLKVSGEWFRLEKDHVENFKSTCETIEKNFDILNESGNPFFK